MLQVLKWELKLLTGQWVLCATGARSRGAAVGASQHRAGKWPAVSNSPWVERLQDSFGANVLALMGLQLEQLRAGGVTVHPVCEHRVDVGRGQAAGSGQPGTACSAGFDQPSAMGIVGNTCSCSCGAIAAQQALPTS